MTSVEPNLSLYQQLMAEMGDSITTVKCTKLTLIHLSHTLEDIVLRESLPAVIFTGFQESSHWKTEADRYDQLANIAHQVCIFAGRPLPAESDASQIHVELDEGDPLRQEWFLMILTDRFSALLCGQDTLIPAAEESYRTFDTIWSFDPALIDRALDTLVDTVAHYRPERLDALKEARRRFPPILPDTELIGEFTLEMIAFEESLTGELRWRQMLMDTALDAVENYVFVLEIHPDETFEAVYISKNINRLMGRDLMTSGSILEGIALTTHPDDIETFHTFIVGMRDGETKQVETRILRDDEIAWIETSVSRSHSLRSDNPMLYGVVRDVTERREHQEMVRAQQKLAAELEKEREVNAIKTYFMTTVMHEFRTPLATILSSSELLERYHDRYDDETRIKRLKGIQSQVIQLRGMLDDIGMIINGDIDRLGFLPEMTDVNAFLTDIVAHFQVRGGREHIVRYESGLNGRSLLVDVRLLRHILRNLLDNAAKFSESGSTIRLESAIKEDTLVLSIHDAGTGITASDLPNIFEAFYRGDNAINVPGAGLGLRIVQDCVNLHQGRVSVEAKPGDGTMVAVHLPLTPEL